MCLKALVFFFTILVIIFLPVYLIIMMNTYLSDVTVLTRTNWFKSTVAEYPKIIVCNSKYFDMRKANG